MPIEVTQQPVLVESLPLPAGAASEETLTSVAADLPTMQLGPRLPSAGLAVAPAASFIEAASNIGGTLPAGNTWTPSDWVDTEGFAQVVTTFISTQVGTLSLLFSADGVTTDVTLPGSLPANTPTPQQVAPFLRYYKPSFTNTSGSPATVRIQTVARATAGIVGSRLVDAVSPLTGSAVVKAVPFGYTEGGGVYQRASMSVQGHQEVEIQGPRTSFGELAVAQDTPGIQVQNFQLGRNDRLISSAVLGTGTVATGTGTERTLVIASSGATAGSRALAASARRLIYKAGQGIKVAMTARFSAPVAGTFMAAGLIDVCDGIALGFDGTTFGILHRAFGQREVRTLTVTVGGGGAETATITLNSVTKAVAISSGTAAATAHALAAADYSATGGGWDAFALVSGGTATVVFIARVATPLSGTYSISSTGTAAGTFAQTTSGVAPTDTWFPQSEWSVDRCDGASTPTAPVSTNPSGIDLTQANLQVCRFQLQYLGAGNIFIAIENPTNGQFTPVHAVERAGNFTITSLGNASLPISLIVDNGAQASNVAVATASIYAATEGTRVLTGPPFAVQGIKSSVTTETPVLTIRNDRVYNGQPNHSPVLISVANLTNTGGNQAAEWRLVRNATLTGASFSRTSSSAPVSQDTSATALTGGETVAYFPQVQGSNSQRLFDQILTEAGRIFPGDTLTFANGTTGSAQRSIASADVRWDL